MVTTPSSMSSLKMSFIIVWKVVGLLVKLKNITKGSKRPHFVLKVAFHLSPSLICMLLYPQWIFVKYLAFCLWDIVNDVWDQREGVGILHSHRIKLLVVLYQAQAPILLLHEED